MININAVFAAKLLNQTRRMFARYTSRPGGMGVKMSRRVNSFFVTMGVLRKPYTQAFLGISKV